MFGTTKNGSVKFNSAKVKNAYREQMQKAVILRNEIASQIKYYKTVISLKTKHLLISGSSGGTKAYNW